MFPSTANHRPALGGDVSIHSSTWWQDCGSVSTCSTRSDDDANYGELEAHREPALTRDRRGLKQSCIRHRHPSAQYARTYDVSSNIQQQGLSTTISISVSQKKRYQFCMQAHHNGRSKKRSFDNSSRDDCKVLGFRRAQRTCRLRS